MTYLVILAALAAVPVVAILVLRVDGAIAFLSLCLGSVLVRYTSGDVGSIASGLSSKVHSGLNQWVNVALLAVPFLLSILFTRKSVTGKKQATNFLPAVASGLLFALMLVPLLNNKLQAHLEAQSIWRTLNNLQTGVILAGAFFSLLFILISHRHHHTSEEKHSKH